MIFLIFFFLFQSNFQPDVGVIFQVYIEDISGLTVLSEKIEYLNGNPEEMIVEQDYILHKDKQDSSDSTQGDILIDKSKCKIDVVRDVDKNIVNLQEKDLLIFIGILRDDVCTNNVEFIGYYNEVLFKVVEKYPVMFCDCLALVENTQLDLIMEELENPINDAINLRMVWTVVSNSDCQSDVRNKILSSLTIALSKVKR